MSKESKEVNDEKIKEHFYALIKSIKKEENHIPRDYRTIGGMWTVDTWKSRDLQVQVMDEGYTTKLLFLENNQVKWSVLNSFNGKEFFELTNINTEEFIRIAPELMKQMPLNENNLAINESKKLKL